MRIVVALGGNALLRRGQPMTAEVQRENIHAAVRALAPLPRSHELILSHGNGPQVGLLALQAACYRDLEPYPLDVLDAQTEGMIGYLIEQELSNLLPPEIPCATVLTMVEVDPADPAFANPAKYVGPSYDREEADRIARQRGWPFFRKAAWRGRSRPSLEIIEALRWVLERGVVDGTGGGDPVTASSGIHPAGPGGHRRPCRASAIDLCRLPSWPPMRRCLSTGGPDARIIGNTTRNRTLSRPAQAGRLKRAVISLRDWPLGDSSSLISSLVEGTAGTQVETGTLIEGYGISAKIPTAIQLRAGDMNLIPDMQEIRVKRTERNGEVEIDIHFKSLSQLLDEDDPAPLPKRELSEFAEETIAGYLDEYRHKKPVTLSIRIPQKDLSEETALIQEAVKNHFSFRVPDLEHELILSRREGMYSFIIAVFNAILAVIFFTFYYEEVVAETIPFLLVLALITILNWVTIWDTYEYFMYDYRNLWRKKRIYQKLTRIPITVSGYGPGKDA
jgi:hypothetical protein